MKTGILILILVTFLGCQGTKFSYVTEKHLKEYGELEPYKIDNSNYDLYTRQVIKVFDKTRNLYTPVNGKVDSTIPLIEIQYLLISKSDSTVFIINNIPDKKIIFYNSKDKIADLGVNADTLKMDIWYFNQFRIGKMKDQKIIFRPLDDTTATHIWNILKYNERIKINSISVANIYGENLQYIDSAFALEMLFFKENRFQFVFKYNAVKTKRKPPPEYNLENETLYIAKDGKETIFKFATPINRYFKNILFSKKRMYAFP